MSLRIFNTLRRRVTLLLFSVLVPAIVLVVMNAISARSRDRMEIQQAAYRLATLATGTHAHLADTIEELFTAISHIPAVTTPDSTACRAALDTLLASGKRFQNLGLLSPDGSVLCSAREVTTGEAGPSHRWLEEAATRDVLVAGTYESSPLADKPTIIIARRVSPADGRILFAAVNLQWFSESAAAVALPPGSAVTIVDDDGTVLARHPDHATWVGRDVRDLPIISTALTRVDGVVEGRGVDGVERLYGFRRVAMPAGSGFTVAVGIPLAFAYAPANARLRTSLIVLAIVAVVTFVVAREASDRLFTQKIDSLLRAARRLSAGDLSARTNQPWSDDEFGELARTFDSMAWVVGQRTEDLRQMMESLRALAARLESVREEERTRISREIHDELGQTLTGIQMDLDRLEERVDALGDLTESDRAPIEAKIRSVRRLAESGLDTARRISRQLRPSVLDVLGLRAGVEWQLEEFHGRTKISTELVAPEDLGDISEAVSIAVFRILQEALTNVMRHAAATAVTVRIDREDGGLVMEVMDNGRGFEQTDRPYPVSLGLLGMRERAATLGGLTTVTSEPGRGTTVYVRIPVKEPPARAGL
jgi:signal transduction histidine kinase